MGIIYDRYTHESNISENRKANFDNFGLINLTLSSLFSYGLFWNLVLINLTRHTLFFIFRLHFKESYLKGMGTSGNLKI